MHTVDQRLPFVYGLWSLVSVILRTCNLVAHDLAVRKVFFAERALRTFLRSLNSEVNPPTDQYEGNRSGDGTLDILIHNSFLQGKRIIKRPEKQTDFVEARKIRLFALG